MVLGVYHFSGPGLDVHNIDAESVLSADRQRELEAVAEGLAAFRHSILEANHATVSRSINAFERQQKTASVSELLIEVNRADFAGGHDTYYRMLPIGRLGDQAGAELNARWYERNAKIFAKLMHVAKPGERVLVVFGAGHGYWLRHFAQEVPGFRAVDPIPFLK